MIDRKLLLGTSLAAALLAPSRPAFACGHGPMGMAAGMVAPAAVPVAAIVALPAIGSTVSVLPEGHLTVVVNGASFFRAGPTWFQPFRGPTGPMYRVVPAPRGM